MILIQSITAGMPVSSTRSGPDREHAGRGRRDGRGGDRALRGDAEFTDALLDELRKAADGELRFDAKAFATIARRFSMQTCVDRYLELYGLA